MLKINPQQIRAFERMLSRRVLERGLKTG